MTEEIRKLTTEEIYAVLAECIGSTDFELLGYEFEKLETKVGLLCDHVTVKTTANIFTSRKDTPDDKDGDHSYPKNIHTYAFFAKFYPLMEAQVLYCEETGAFAKEIFMYELFARIKNEGVTLLDCVPRCYYMKDNHVIVTENLAKQGYDLISKNETLDYDTVLTVVRSLAKMHASSVIFEEGERKKSGEVYTFLKEYRNRFQETYFYDREDRVNLNVESAIKGILSEIDIFHCPAKLTSGKDFKTLANEVCHRIYDLVKPTDKYRNVICHGDLWATNFLIKRDAKGLPIDCKFVDFQGGRYLPPPHDLMSFLYLTTTRKFRKNHMYDVIGLYYYHLEKFLKAWQLDVKEIFPFSSFMECCEEQKLFAIYQSATHFQLVLIDNDRLHELFSDTEFSEYTFGVDRTPMILANIDVNENYRRRLEESVLDLQDYCESL